MKQIICTAVILVSLLLPCSGALAVEPYIQIGVGAFSRNIVEEDAAISGFKFKGTAGSTRLIAKAGLEIGKTVNLYVQGGGADLSIDEFDNFASSMKGMVGGGLRINLYQAPYRDGLRLFIEGNALRFTADDRIETVVSCTAGHGCPADTGNSIPLLANETIQWNEYTVLLGASGRYFDTAPYGGLRLSKVDGKDRIKTAPDSNFSNGFQASPDIKEDGNFGIFFGLDFFLDRSEKTVLNFEISLIDQDSFMAAVRRTF
ncbi:MAG: hypothetical protein HY283_03975 [Nitrospirae bacterium]|nr:hypothetical protein [Nitrospirota bacterium]